MLTAQPAAAREFFGTLLRWTYVEMPGMGHRVQVGGRDIGGLFDLDGPSTPPGTPPYIGVMVKVDSADATCQRVAALGGRSMPAFDIMDQGRMAVCFDPNGAEFDVWEPRMGQGTDADSTRHGAPSRFETLTPPSAGVLSLGAQLVLARQRRRISSDTLPSDSRSRTIATTCSFRSGESPAPVHD